jgi:hypothetical protein
MHHDEIAARGFGRDILELEPVRRRIDELGAFDESGGLGEPSRVPEGLDLAPRLIARPRSAVEPVE